MTQKNTLLPHLANYFLEMTENLLAIIQQNRIVEANTSFLKALDMTAAMARQQPLLKCVDERTQKILTPILKNNKKALDIPLTFVNQKGEKIETIARLVPVLINKETAFLLEAVHQKTLVELKKKCALLEERNMALAPIDTRTGLPTMILFEDRTNQAFLRALRDAHGVLADVRLFVFIVVAKIVGWDEMEPKVQDSVVKKLISRFQSSVRSVDTLIWDTNHNFYFLFENLQHKENIHDIIKRLNDCTNVPLFSKGVPIHVHLEFGYASYPENGASAAALINQAKLHLH